MLSGNGLTAESKTRRSLASADFSADSLTVCSLKNSLRITKATHQLGRARLPPVDAPFFLESTRFLHGIRRSDRS